MRRSCGARMRVARIISIRSSSLVLAVTLIGCARSEPPAPVASREPVSVQMLRVVPDLKNQRFLTVLSFENSSDSVFVAPISPGPLRIDPSVVHTGAQSLRIDPSTGGVVVKLSSAVANGTLPGTWTMGGAYFLSREPGAEVAATVKAGEVVVSKNVVKLAPDEWNAVYADVWNLSEAAAGDVGAGKLPLTVQFELLSRAPVWLDDVLLVDNAQLVLKDDGSAQGGGWSITRRGLNYLGDLPGHFRFTLPTPEDSPDGWTVVEANSIRARFVSRGAVKNLSIYPDGRALWDGQYHPVGDARYRPALAEAHASPANIKISPEFGRVERNTPGDANNDGYNEVRGAYPLISAAGTRLEFTLEPRSKALSSPVLEIRGLVAGSVVVNVEGRLVERTVRLDDGTVLVEIPGPIDRATVVYLRVQ